MILISKWFDPVNYFHSMVLLNEKWFNKLRSTIYNQWINIDHTETDRPIHFQDMLGICFDGDSSNIGTIFLNRKKVEIQKRCVFNVTRSVVHFILLSPIYLFGQFSSVYYALVFKFKFSFCKCFENHYAFRWWSTSLKW